MAHNVTASEDDLNEVVSVSDLADNKGITVLQWNCRSLYNKLDEIVHINTNSKGDICIYTVLDDTKHPDRYDQPRRVKHTQAR